jgi:hypothetical protein
MQSAPRHLYTQCYLHSLPPACNVANYSVLHDASCKALGRTAAAPRLPRLHHAVNHTLDHSSVPGCGSVPHNQGAGRLLVPLDGRPVASGKAPDGQQLQQHDTMTSAAV